MADRKKIFKLLLIVLITATLLFIFVNSCLPREVSSMESEAVGGFISSLFPEGTWMNRFLSDNIRKIAHFAEFGVLGCELALYVLLFCGKIRKKTLCLLVPAAPIFGFVDETIQIFSDRGPAIIDVWIDAFGFWSFAAVTVGIYAGTVYLSGKRNVEK